MCSGVAGYEGIHPDDKGNLLLAEDVGGNDDRWRRPAAELLRLPIRARRFHESFRGGQLQALQVTIEGHTLRFNDPATGGSAAGDTLSMYQVLLHKPGSAWPVKWVTVTRHRGGWLRAIRRQRQGQDGVGRRRSSVRRTRSSFQILSSRRSSSTRPVIPAPPPAISLELAARGAWGSIFRVDMLDALNGTIAIVVLGDRDHSSFDNLAFADQCTLLATEDRGDTLHDQLNTLDSVWAFDICKEARRSAATRPRPRRGGHGRGTTSRRACTSRTASRQCGDSSGRAARTWSNMSRWRWFFTQQHGVNTVYEIVKSR